MHVLTRTWAPWDRGFLRPLLGILILAGCGASSEQQIPEVTLIGSGCAAGSPFGSSLLANQLDEAEYIFRGTVLELHAKTIPDPIDLGNVAIVRVDVPIWMTPSEVPFTPELTLQMQSDLAVGDQFDFIAQIEEYNGGQLELSELTRLAPGAKDLGALKSLLLANPLYARVASADLIIDGTVTDAVSLNEPLYSEHAPMWSRATIAVDRVLCGTVPSPMTIDFAASDDVAWYQAPKLSVDESSIFLVHHADMQLPFSDPTPSRFTIDPLDVQPESNWDDVASLLATPPAP
jgi:hypothetical protein